MASIPLEYIQIAKELSQSAIEAGILPVQPKDTAADVGKLIADMMNSILQHLNRRE